MENLKIEYLPVESLKPYEKNARKHQKKDIDAIIESIKEFGFDDPIGIWSDDNLIVEGHGRLLAAQRLGMSEVPCIRLDHLSDEQRKAYALAHNKTAELSSWLDELVKSEIGDITDIDMSLFGFETEDFSLSEADKIVEEETDREVPFAEYIDEVSQYIVLKFTTEADWNNAVSMFGLEQVKTYSTRKDGQQNGVGCMGLGRVIDGMKAIQMIEQNYKDMND